MGQHCEGRTVNISRKKGPKDNLDNQAIKVTVNKEALNGYCRGVLDEVVNQMI